MSTIKANTLLHSDGSTTTPPSYTSVGYAHGKGLGSI